MGVNGSVLSSLINTGIIIQVYPSVSGKPRLDEAGFERILRNCLEWLRKAYGKAVSNGGKSQEIIGIESPPNIA